MGMGVAWDVVGGVEPAAAAEEDRPSRTGGCAGGGHLGAVALAREALGAPPVRRGAGPQAIAVPVPIRVAALVIDARSPIDFTAVVGKVAKIEKADLGANDMHTKHITAVRV